MLFFLAFGWAVGAGVGGLGGCVHALVLYLFLGGWPGLWRYGPSGRCASEGRRGLAIKACGKARSWQLALSLDAAVARQGPKDHCGLGSLSCRFGLLTPHCLVLAVFVGGVELNHWDLLGRPCGGTCWYVIVRRRLHHVDGFCLEAALSQHGCRQPVCNSSCAVASARVLHAEMLASETTHHAGQCW